MGREQKRKNIVLLMTDQLRGDCMGLRGASGCEDPLSGHTGIQRGAV